MTVQIEPFQWAADDPLAPEFALIEEVVVAAVHKNGARYFNPVDLKSSDAGQKIGSAKGDDLARIIQALVRRARFLDAQKDQVQAAIDGESQRLNWDHADPEAWRKIWPPRCAVWSVLKQVLRKKTVLSSEQISEMCCWLSSADPHLLEDYFYPVKSFSRIVTGLGQLFVIHETLRDEVKKLARHLDHSIDPDAKKVGRQLADFLNPRPEVAQEFVPMGREARMDLTKPVAAGHPARLVALKVFLGILPQEAPPGDTVIIGDDAFPLRHDSQLRAEHELITAMSRETPCRTQRLDLSSSATGGQMLQKKGRALTDLGIALAERAASLKLTVAQRPGSDAYWQAYFAIDAACTQILERAEELSRESFFDIALFLSAERRSETDWSRAFLTRVEAFASDLTPGERHVLHRLRCAYLDAPALGVPSELVASLSKAIGDGLCLALVPGEAWSDSVNLHVSQLAGHARVAWLEFLRHIAKAASAQPSPKWLKSTHAHLSALGKSEVENALIHWFKLLAEPRPIRFLEAARPENSLLDERNADCLRGLLWTALTMPSPQMIEAVRAVENFSSQKIPRFGTRSTKTTHAAAFALNQMKQS